MPSRTIVRLMAENLPEHRILEAIFLPERTAGLLKVSSYLTSSAAVAAAVGSVLERPDVPLALVLNTKTDDPAKIDDERRTISRILYRNGPADWHVALAVPDVDSWLMADPRVRQVFEADEVTRTDRYERAVRAIDLARAAPIDREAIGRAHPEFRALNEFIVENTRVPQTSP
jgi:hypothetical protein